MELPDWELRDDEVSPCLLGDDVEEPPMPKRERTLYPSLAMEDFFWLFDNDLGLACAFFVGVLVEVAPRGAEPPAFSGVGGTVDFSAGVFGASSSLPPSLVFFGVLTCSGGERSRLLSLLDMA